MRADVDFANSREARGATINFSATLHPTNHLAVEILRNQRRLDVLNQRLLTARVSRVKSIYTFTSRVFVRGIVQFVSAIATRACSCPRWRPPQAPSAARSCSRTS